MKKLKELAKLEGYESVTEMIEECMWGSTVPAICTNQGCDCVKYLEPDQDAGWCSECETKTVVSCLVLAGVI